MTPAFEVYVASQDPDEPEPDGWEVPVPVKKIEEEDC